MIPTRLELRNFLAYRAPEPIVFHGIELACLAGQNGVGKSALLDAITWALWGKARAKRDDDLIHLGQKEMQVSLDFLQAGIRYRVQRRRALTGRGMLDLLVWGADERPRIINETGMRRTQEKINDILHLEYETFVHSAFLQQGRADAFTVKTAAERKRILAELLGLDRWTAYAENVKDKLSDLNRQIDLFEHDIGRMEEEISRETELQAKLDIAVAECDAAQAKLDRIDEQYNQLLHSAAMLQRERENRLALERVIAGRRDDMTAAKAEIERQDDKIAEYEEIVAQAAGIETGYQQLREVRENQTALAEQLVQNQELDAQIHQLEAKLSAQRTELLRQRDVLQERVAGLEQQVASAATADLEAITSEIMALENLEKQRADSVKTVQSMRERRSGLRARLDTLKTEGMALNDRLRRLEAADGATCPLCGQTLTANHREEMLAQLTKERDEKRGDYRRGTTQIQQIDLDNRQHETDLETLAMQLKKLPALQGRRGALDAQQSDAQDARDKLQLERSQLVQIQAQLDMERYGLELRQQLGQLEETRLRSSYDAGSAADNKAQLETLNEFDRRQKQLEFAQINLPEAQTLREKTMVRMNALRESLHEDEEKLEANEGEIEKLEGQAQLEGQVRRELDAIRGEVQTTQEQRAILQQELNAIAVGRESVKRLQKRLDDCLHARGLLQELRTAYGRNGVPAMIIETVIPELEAEANDLLARMTDGRMTIGFSTQREKITGGLAETLDIEIADELGARDYELYSGGEAFRINFAIRIALSKLLARRAGAQLRTLFIDEGFGSQDVDGRDKLVDAISKIQSDFDLILVITHFEELRESFPVQIMVEKTANGSMVTVQ